MSSQRNFVAADKHTRLAAAAREELRTSGDILFTERPKEGIIDKAIGNRL
jgi:hypothetical protein